jgi:hypothetical protein
VNAFTRTIATVVFVVGALQIAAGFVYFFIWAFGAYTLEQGGEKTTPLELIIAMGTGFAISFGGMLWVCFGGVVVVVCDLAFEWKLAQGVKRDLSIRA